MGKGLQWMVRARRDLGIFELETYKNEKFYSFTEEQKAENKWE